MPETIILPHAEEHLALSLRGVSKRYGAMMALDGVDFDVPRGQVTALLGENGAGKSTLVKVLSGGVTPDSGMIRSADGDRDIAGSGRRLAQRVSVVQQEGSLIPTLSIAENVFLGRSSPGRTWTRRGLVRAARAYLDQVGLTDLDPQAAAGELSVAEGQLVEVARLLARDAPVLVFDEPTASLSDIEIEKVMAVIRQLTAAGRAVVYVTHRLGEVFELATEATVLRNGKVAARLRIADTDMNEIVSSMLGREVGVLFPPPSTGFREPILEVVAARADGLTDDLNLVVRSGEILGLAGQIGSGSAIALRVMAGQVHIHGGAMRVLDRDVTGATSASMRLAGVAYCSGDRKRDGFFGLRSVIDNLSSASLDCVTRLGWIVRRREHAAARAVAGTVGIAPTRLRIPVGALSGGNQQKVVLGKWIAARPQVLLVDEPTRGVDVGARAEIYKLLRNVSDRGMAIVVCSSDLTEILGLCDTVATFYRGRIVSIGPAADMTDVRATREVTQGPKTVATDAVGR